MFKCLKIKKRSKRFTPFRDKSLTGFTLLEVMAAIFVVTVGLMGIFTVIQNLSAQTSISSNRLIASYLAQEGIEIIRNIRDTNWLEQKVATSTSWDEGLTGCSAGCEIDYFCTTVEDPNPNDPNGHRCLDLYGVDGHFLRIDTNGFYNYASGNETKFRRKIILTKEGNDVLKVEVLIRWQEKGKNYEISTLEKLHNWY